MPELGPGQVLVQNHYLSLDPYMRGRMNEGKSYAEPQPLDQVMVRDLLPPELEADQANGVAHREGRDVVWEVGELKPKEKRKLKLSALAARAAERSVNQAVATAVAADAAPTRTLQAHAEAGMDAGKIGGRDGSLAAYHHAGAGHDAVLVSGNDATVDARTQAEVVSVHDELASRGHRSAPHVGQ